MPRHRYVNDCGSVVRMTERKYLAYLRAGAQGENPDPAKYGTVIAHLAFHAIDAKPADFADALDTVEAR